MKKLLVLGGTGIMGGPLSLRAAQEGFTVDAVSLDARSSDLPNLRYIQTADARDPQFLDEILKNRYDVIVDFMTYNSISFRRTAPKFLEHCDQYFYLSSCRVFADEDTYLHFRQPDFDPAKYGWMRWQMKYGRLLRRIYDTTKMLDATGLKQEQFLSLYDGLCQIKKALG